METNREIAITDEQENLAYIQGDAEKEELIANIPDLHAKIKKLEDELEDAKDDSLERWGRHNGDAEAYKEFFYDCFKRLEGHYPCPSISSDYDKNIIFEAIERGVTKC